MRVLRRPVAHGDQAVVVGRQEVAEPDSDGGADGNALPQPMRVEMGGGAKRTASDAPAHSPAAEVGANAYIGAETCSESGGVGRRARPVIKPFFRSLPRLTLKAGHKAGLPTTPIAVFGATKRRPSSLPFF